MAITTFDTHKFVRRLEEAGIPTEQAEVQVELLTEAFTLNLESSVTKDYFESRLDARFAEQDAKIEARFAAQDAKFDSNFRVLFWIQAIITAAVVIPYLERLMAL